MTQSWFDRALVRHLAHMDERRVGSPLGRFAATIAVLLALLCAARVLPGL